jgi:hypothetical protein
MVTGATAILMATKSGYASRRRRLQLGYIMIARIWHGRTAAAKADEYLAFLQGRALPDYRGTAGNVAAFILRRIDGDVAHFITLTHGNRSVQSRRLPVPM